MVEIILDFDSDDNPSVKTISILEDYWHDYLHFKELATAENGNSELRHRRYLRAAFLLLIAYTEGVVNQWWFSILKEEGKSQSEIDKFLRQHFPVKCNKLTRKASLIPQHTHVIENAKRLRNDLVHLTIGNDARLFDGLSEELIDQTEAAITGWLDQTSTALGMERHPDTQKIGRELAKALGTMKHEEYSVP